MNSVLLRVELRRSMRNRRTLVFTAVLPAMFFLIFSAANPTGTLDGVSVAPYLMVSMATYGAMNALFTGGGLIAAERAIGWPRQLRVAGLRGRDYVLTKIIIAYLTALPGLVIVFVLGATNHHVRMASGRWLLLGASVLLALMPVAALGVAIGYLVRAQSLQALTGIGSAMLALLGGIWVPAEQFPRLLFDTAKLLPTYWAAEAGRAVLRHSWIGWEGVAVVAIWTLVLGVVAARGYQRDALRPAAAGAT